MFTKSFIVLDGNCRLTGARTTKQYPYDHNSSPCVAVRCNSILNTTQNGHGLNTVQKISRRATASSTAHM